MRIMWICGGLLPEACRAIGVSDNRVNGGFMNAALMGLADADERNEFCVLSWDSRRCNVHLGRMWYVSFGGSASICLKGVPRKDCQQARDIINTFRPDIIHILGTEGLFAHMPDEVFKGYKTVISLQGIISACAANYAASLTKRELQGTWVNYAFFRYGTTINREQRFWQECRAQLEADTIRRHSNFIGRTQFDHAWVDYYNPSARYFDVGECLRNEFYGGKVERSAIRRRTIYCGNAASYPLKGGHIALQAIAALKQTYPDVQLRIANAAALSTRISLKTRMQLGYYALCLRRLIKNLGLQENIVALPTLSAQEVRSELDHAELFVLPSFCENSPNSLGEAMMAGCPSIASDVGGVSSMIDNGNTGRLIPPGDPAILAKAIRDWFEDPIAASKCAEAARSVAMKRHDRASNAVALLSVYRKIIEDR